MTSRCRAFAPGDFYINGELDIVVKFAVDSLLEEDGFEPSVPRHGQPFFATPAQFASRGVEAYSLILFRPDAELSAERIR